MQSGDSRSGLFLLVWCQQGVEQEGRSYYVLS